MGKPFWSNASGFGDLGGAPASFSRVPSLALAAGPDSFLDSFIFRPLLLILSEYPEISFLSRWRASLNRSANKFCNINRKSSRVAPEGIFATISNLSVLSQLGPEIRLAGTLYMPVSKVSRGTLVYMIRSGSGPPGPPSMDQDLVSREDGLTDATSNCGRTLVACARLAGALTRPIAMGMTTAVIPAVASRSLLVRLRFCAR